MERGIVRSASTRVFPNPACQVFRAHAPASAPQRSRGRGLEAAWIASGATGLALILALVGITTGSGIAADISITPRGVWPGFGYQRYAASVEVSGNFAYVGHASDGTAWGRGNLSIVDISDPASPRWVGGYPVASGIGPTRVTLAGRYIHGISEGGIFLLIDPVNPTEPRLVGSLSLNSKTHALASRGSASGWLTHIAAGTAGLHIVEVTEPSGLRKVGTLGVGEDVMAIAVTADHAFLGAASGRIQIVETKDPSHPVAVGSVQMSGPITSVRVRGNLALVTDTTAGLSLLDLTDLGHPAVVWRDDRPGRATDSAFGTGMLAAYAVDGHGTGTSELRLLDIANPAQPARIGLRSWPRQPMALALEGNRAYLAEEIYMGPSGLQVFELNLLVFHEPPVVVAEPTDQVVTPGGAATLAALVRGTPPLRFQWFRLDSAQSWREVAGATNPWIVKAPVTANDLGAWRLVTANAAGSVTSRVSTIEPLALARTSHVRIDNPTPRAPFSSWESAATNLQDAVDFTAPGGTVLVSNGVYRTGVTRSNGLNRVVLGKPVLLLGVGGPERTIIAGQSRWGPSGEGVRCVFVGDGATVSGFTLTGGWGQEGGGGAWCEPRGSLTNCIISGNTATSANIWLPMQGGGVRGGMVIDCRLTANGATHGGGASESVLERCTLQDNVAHGLISAGGGAYQSTLVDCLVISNRCTSDGGGVDTCALTHCQVIGNAALSGGGASRSKLHRCVLRDNAARDVPGFASDEHHGGGAIHSLLHNCLLVGNQAETSGGGVIQCTGTNGLVNCTLIANHAGIRGGGAAQSRLANCIVVGNDAPSHPNVFESTCSDSCISPGPAPGAGNLEANPRFVSPETGDFRLRPDSPCIDAGNNDRSPPQPDLGGGPRILDGNADGVAQVDMGAHEFDPTVPFLTRIEPTPVGLRLEWLPARKGARLQRSATLSAPEWQDVPGSESVTGITLTVPDAAVFFRLVVP